MSATELRKKLIDRIQNTSDENLLEEAYRLLGMGTDDTQVYKLSHEQSNAVNEGRLQIQRGESLTDDQVNKEIDEWLNK